MTTSRDAQKFDVNSAHTVMFRSPWRKDAELTKEQAYQ